MEENNNSILDDILSIANGGCTADKIQAFIKWEHERVSQADIQARHYFQLIKTHGIMYVMIPDDKGKGYTDIEWQVNGNPAISEELSNSFYLKTVLSSSTTYSLKKNRQYHAYIPEFAHMSKMSLSEDSKQLCLHINADKIQSYELTNLQPLPVGQYVDSTIANIKLLIQTEVSKALGCNKTSNYDSPTKDCLFFSGNFHVTYRTSRIAKLTKSAWLNLIKLLYPTVITDEGNINNICSQIMSQALLPRDFGITDVDKLLSLYATLLDQPLNNKLGIARNRCRDWTQKGLVEEVVAAGGSLHGGKVGHRKNFKEG
jgi:hypothetical protein